MQDNNYILIDCKITSALMGTIVKKSQNVLTTNISESSEFSDLIAKLYFRSMPNIKIMTSGGHGYNMAPDTPLEYRPSPILLAYYVGPQMRRMIEIVNAAVMALAIEAKSRANSSPLRQNSDNVTYNECLSDIVSPVEVTGLPARRSISLPNISISVALIDIEMQMLADDSHKVASIIVKK